MTDISTLSKVLGWELPPGRHPKRVLFLVEFLRDPDRICVLADDKRKAIMFAHKRVVEIFHLHETAGTEPLPQHLFNPPWTDDTTAAAPGLWRWWLTNCIKNHDGCKCPSEDDSHFAPRRLIKASPADEGRSALSWRLVETRSDFSEPYLTLSHCWGGQVPHKLVVDNYQNMLEEEQDPQLLSKTFKDALQITLDLGYQYIWIDSLCIIQDSKEDWTEQSVLMHKVYTYSRCNIAATAAQNGSRGCFQNRDWTSLQDTSINMSRPGMSNVTWDVVKVDFSEKVDSAPLNTRGWVVQERLLSPRQLMFTQDRVFWECPCFRACERFPLGAPISAWELQSRPWLSGRSPEVWAPIWAYAVEKYTSCKLTYQSDKAVAFAGIVSVFQRWTGLAYLAGMWRHELISQLCWMVKDGIRGDGYQAPSWSWMSVQGTIDFAAPFRKDLPTPAGVDLAAVVDVRVESHDPDRRQNFSAGSLTIRGLVLGFRLGSHLTDSENPFTIDTLEGNTARLSHAPFLYRGPTGSPSPVGWELDTQLGLVWDDKGPPPLTDTGSYGLVVLQVLHPQTYRGIVVLDTAAPASTVFKRVGSFNVQNNDEFVKVLSAGTGVEENSIHSFLRRKETLTLRDPGVEEKSTDNFLGSEETLNLDGPEVEELPYDSYSDLDGEETFSLDNLGVEYDAYLDGEERLNLNNLGVEEEPNGSYLGRKETLYLDDVGVASLIKEVTII